MRLRHVGLVYSSEERADRFLVGALGLRKSEPKLLAAELCRAIFDHDGALQMINYTDDALFFEVFIDSRCPARTRPFEHVSLEVEDCAGFLERCRRANASIRRVPRGDSVLIFVSDEDHNLFEIKPGATP